MLRALLPFLALGAAVEAEDVAITGPPGEDGGEAFAACEKSCEVNGVSQSCKTHIQELSLADFLSAADPCGEAQHFVAEQCPACGKCRAAAAGCGVLELPPTPAPTIVIPEGGICETMCSFGLTDATCNERIIWAANNVYGKIAGSCEDGRDLVLKQCPVCANCELENVKCIDASMVKDQHFDSEVFQKYDGAVRLRLGHAGQRSDAFGGPGKLAAAACGLGLLAALALVASRRTIGWETYSAARVPASLSTGLAE